MFLESEAAMINGAHIVLYTTDAEADRPSFATFSSFRL